MCNYSVISTYSVDLLPDSSAIFVLFSSMVALVSDNNFTLILLHLQITQALNTTKYTPTMWTYVDLITFSTLRKFLQLDGILLCELKSRITKLEVLYVCNAFALPGIISRSHLGVQCTDCTFFHAFTFFFFSLHFAIRFGKFKCFFFGLDKNEEILINSDCWAKNKPGTWTNIAREFFFFCVKCILTMELTCIMVCQHHHETTTPCTLYHETAVSADMVMRFDFLQRLAHRSFALQRNIETHECIYTSKWMNKRDLA